MSHRSSNILVGITCFILGYAVNSAVNINDKDVKLSQKTNDGNGVFTSIQPEAISQKMIAPKKSKPDVAANKIAIKKDIIDDSFVVPKDHSPVDEDNMGENNAIELRELNEWAVAHRRDIEELISAHMSSATAEGMKVKFIENNDFLTKPSVMQTKADDDNWSYDMKQKLTYLIEEHELSHQFELLSLSCKQLICEILGIDKARIWMPLYINLLQNEPTLIPSNKDSAFKGVNYIDGDVSFLYTQLQFKSS